MFCVNLVAIFNHKARLLMIGHSKTYDIMRRGISKDDKIIWFHAASLGEFEQGRPLIEKIRANHPGYKILLTFFSPSGYEVRKDYKGADVICYLPFDTKLNARKFLKIAHPPWLSSSSMSFGRIISPACIAAEYPPTVWPASSAPTRFSSVGMATSTATCCAPSPIYSCRTKSQWTCSARSV